MLTVVFIIFILTHIVTTV